MATMRRLRGCLGEFKFIHSEKTNRKKSYSADYHEDGPVYRCDPIRNMSAGLAIVDAAYGSQETTVPDAQEAIITIVKDLLSTHASVLMPVPKHGRGLDMICLLSSNLPDVPLYADTTQLTELHADPLGF